MENMKFKGKTIKEPKKEPEYKYPIKAEDTVVGQKYEKFGKIYERIKVEDFPDYLWFYCAEDHTATWHAAYTYLSATPPPPKSINWLTLDYIKQQSKLGVLPALLCSIEHWEQFLEAGPKLTHEAMMACKVSVKADFCSLCLRYYHAENETLNCSACVLNRDCYQDRTLFCRCVAAWPDASRAVYRASPDSNTWPNAKRIAIEKMVNALKSYIPKAKEMDKLIDPKSCTVADLKDREKCEIKGKNWERVFRDGDDDGGMFFLNSDKQSSWFTPDTDCARVLKNKLKENG